MARVQENRGKGELSLELICVIILPRVQFSFEIRSEGTFFWVRLSKWPIMMRIFYERVQLDVKIKAPLRERERERERAEQTMTRRQKQKQVNRDGQQEETEDPNVFTEP